MAQAPLDTHDDSIMKFANSVRTALSNEPGRRYMEEQVREGFQFLDDYLADVVNGTWRSQDIFQVAKTPSRRQDHAQRERPAASSCKPRHAALPPHQRMGEKENLAPLEHTLPTLDETKSEHSTSRTSHPRPPSTRANGDVRSAHFTLPAVSQQPIASTSRREEQPQHVHDSTLRPAIVVRRPAATTNTDGAGQPTSLSTDDAIPVHSPDLSAIAEDAVEEGGSLSHGNSSLHVTKDAISLSEKPVQVLLPQSAQPKAAEPLLKFSLPDIPRFKPRATAPPAVPQVQTHQYDPSPTPLPKSELVSEPTMSKAPSPPSLPPAAQDTVNAAPAPVQATSADTVPQRRTPLLAQGVTPKALPGGKRTSWLHRAREYAAVTGGTRASVAPTVATGSRTSVANLFARPNTPGPVHPGPSEPRPKRKSELMLAQDQTADEEHRSKAPRRDQLPTAVAQESETIDSVSSHESDSDLDLEGTTADHAYTFKKALAGLRAGQSTESLAPGTSGSTLAHGDGTTANGTRLVEARREAEEERARERAREQEEARQREAAEATERQRQAQQAQEAERERQRVEWETQQRLEAEHAEHQRRFEAEAEAQRAEAVRQERERQAQAERQEQLRRDEAEREDRRRCAEAEATRKRDEEQRQQEAEQIRFKHERFEQELREQERLDRLEQERLDRLEQERLDRLEQDRLNRLEQERLGRLEQERLEQELLEQERLDRLERERLDRSEQERLTAARLERQRLEQVRVQEERQLQERRRQEDAHLERQREHEDRIHRQEEEERQERQRQEKERQQLRRHQQAQADKAVSSKKLAPAGSPVERSSVSGASDLSLDSLTRAPSLTASAPGSSSVFKPPPPKQHIAFASSVFKPREPTRPTGTFRDMYARAADPILPKASSSHLPRPDAGAVSSQSTMSSIASDKIFDDDDLAPGWAAKSQDTEAGESQPSRAVQGDDGFEAQEAPSWMVDNNMDTVETWKLLHSGSIPHEDTVDTWSTGSRKIATIRLSPAPNGDELAVEAPRTNDSRHGAENVPEGRRSVKNNVPEPDREAVEGDVDPEDEGQFTASGSSHQHSRESSHDLVPASSSNFIVDGASKLLHSVFGLKKPVKSLQLASAAARKDDEDKEKKALRLRNQESRRLVAQQRKADEERARAEGEQKRIKEEQEKRKREREDTTDKRPIKLPTKKTSDEGTKKRKLLPDGGEKKTLHKKQLSKDVLPLPARTAGKPKPGLVKQPSVPALATAVASTHAAAPLAGTSSIHPYGSKSSERPANQGHSKTPSRAVAPPQPPPEKSENIELPDIASEYSDSDDEERNNKKRAMPFWVQSPDVRNALARQNTLNPDGIFGGVQELHMEEIFPGRVARFRARTSSAQWTGTDGLTAEEEEAYAARMRYEQ